MSRTHLLVLALLAATACKQPMATAHQGVHASSAAVMPELVADTPVELPGLHNVVRYTEAIISGAVPVGDEGFATLEALGIKTIVSVDGATPQVELAERHGLRYVHVPISYDDLPKEKAAEMAMALTSLEGPFYMHCHHGKHRSAASAAAASVCAGLLTNEEAAARMKVSGTSDNYAGLWASVAAMQPLPEEQLHRDPASFPKIAKVSGMVATMAELDVVFDNLKTLDKNSWNVPDEHPDLVPTKETKRLHALFAGLRRDPESMAHVADYQQRLDTAIEIATDLDSAVRSGDAASASRLFEDVGRSCKDCHKPYRNQ